HNQTEQLLSEMAQRDDGLPPSLQKWDFPEVRAAVAAEEARERAQEEEDQAVEQYSAQQEEEEGVPAWMLEVEPGAGLRDPELVRRMEEEIRRQAAKARAAADAAPAHQKQPEQRAANRPR